MNSRERRSRRADFKQKGEVAFGRALHEQKRADTWDERNAMAEAARAQRDQERQNVGETELYRAVKSVDVTEGASMARGEFFETNGGDIDETMESAGTKMSGRRAKLMIDSWSTDRDKKARQPSDKGHRDDRVLHRQARELKRSPLPGNRAVEAFQSEPAVRSFQAANFAQLTLDDLIVTAQLQERDVINLRHNLEVLQRPDAQQFLQPILQQVEQFLHHHADYLRDTSVGPETYLKRYVFRVLDQGFINHAIAGPNPRLEDVKRFLSDALMKGLEDMESWFDEQRAMTEGVNMHWLVREFKEQVDQRLFKQSYAA